MAKKKPTKPSSRDASWMFIDRAADVNSDDEESSTESSEPLERHPEFFFDNTLIAIQIGKTLFNVHKYQLAKSQVFSDRFKSPRQGDEPEEGLTPERPIKLKGVSASEFAALLRVLYASHFSSNQPAPEPPLIIPAFRLAYMLNFSELRTFLLPLAEKNMNDVDKIVFAREFDIKQWLIPAHVHLCRRDKSLNTEEARKLGVDSVLIISRMREQHRSGNQSVNLPFIVGQCYCHVCGGMNHKNSGYSQACSGCNGIHGTAYLRYNGSSLMTTTQSGPTTINGAAIEAGVKKWVEDGCTIKD